MNQKIKKFLLSYMALLPLLLPAGVSAATVTNSLCHGADNLTISSTDQSECGINGKAADDKFNSIIETALNLFSAIVGFVAVVMLIFGGFRYITSAGDSNRVSGAKNTIIYALIGLVIVALAQVIVQFVLHKANNP